MCEYCGYLEKIFDLLHIGEKNEPPLVAIVGHAFDEGRVSEDVACLFLGSGQGEFLLYTT